MTDSTMVSQDVPTVSERWDAFIGWARRFAEWDQFDTWERNYKLEIGENLQAARTALLGEAPNWLDGLERAFGPPNNLTGWRFKDVFLKWCRADPNAAASALKVLWDPAATVTARIDEFLSIVPRTARRTPTRDASFLHMAMGPTQFPFYRWETVNKAFELTGYPRYQAKGHHSSGAEYEHFLAFLDRILAEASSRGLTLRDRLDAQSVVWSIQRHVPEDWSESDRQALRAYRGDVPPNAQDETASAGNATGGQGSTGSLPDVPRTVLLDAMVRFDAELRHTDAWAGWEHNGNHRYAIAQDGQRYPVKQIVAMATGVPTSGFSGGDQANRYVTTRGLTIVPLHTTHQPTAWWVNQGATYKHERDGGYLWAPKQGKGGFAFGHWTNMTRLRRGDIVLHYANGALRAVSEVREPAIDAPRPAELPAEPWAGDGYLVKTAYHEFTEPLPLATIPESWRTPGDGPFTQEHGVKQGYLFPVPKGLMGRLLQRFPDRWPRFVVDAFEGEPPDLDGMARVFKIAPGPDAMYWDECLDGGYICVGWDEVGDLRQYPNKAAFLPAFTQQFAEEYNHRAPKISEKANELWTLIELQPGDRIVANRGTSEVLAIGEVVAPGYEWRTDRTTYRHTVRVDWDTSVATSIPKQPSWGMRTIAPVPAELLKLILNRQALDDDYVAPLFAEIVAHIGNQGLRLAERTLRRYHLSLTTRGFVILAGPSGTGKTWLAEAYAQAVGARHALISVAPNWTTNEDLLGYFNPLTGQYHDTTFSRFLREAARAYMQASAAGQTPRPYHLVLDELNLARVEYYFAAFLSAMEVRVRHGTASLALGPEETVLLSPNLAVIGTVNIDETTHGFADKVYDRAQLVELDLRREDLATHLGTADYREDLLAIWDAVAGVGPFAFRTLDELTAYVTGAEALGVPWAEAVDEQLVQKVLPKLKGADPAIGMALEQIVALT